LRVLTRASHLYLWNGSWKVRCPPRKDRQELILSEESLFQREGDGRNYFIFGVILRERKIVPDLYISEEASAKLPSMQGKIVLKKKKFPAAKLVKKEARPFRSEGKTDEKSARD